MNIKNLFGGSSRVGSIAATLVAGSICGLTTAVTVSAQTAPGTWTMKAPLPAIRAEVAAVALDGKLHAIGGAVNGTAGPYHDEYDPATNTWRARAPLPEGRDHLGVAVAGGKIYAFGGFVGSVHKGAGTGAFEYDPGTDAWRVLAPMKAPRASVGAATVDGKIHVIGGRGLDGVVVATHEVYDPKSGQWSEAAPLPTARDHMVIIAVDGKIHAIGGRFKGPVDRTGLHEVYDPATDKWTSAAPLPTPRSGLASAYYHGLILCWAVSCRLITRSPTTRAMIPRPAVGPLSRRCRMDGTVLAAPRSAITPTSSAARYRRAAAARPISSSCFISRNVCRSVALPGRDRIQLNWMWP